MDLWDLSFRNRVEYHREDLIAIHEGAKCREVFTDHTTRVLSRYKILERSSNRNHAPLVLSEETRRVLGID